MSTLTVQNLRGVSPTNQITIPTGHKLYAPGSVVQVVQTVKTDTWSAAPGVGAYSAVTGFSATITPTTSNSKILVMINAYVGYNAYMMKGLVKRNGTILVRGDDLGSSRPRVSFALNTYAAGNETYHLVPLVFNYLDSPATSSSCVYTVELGSYSTNIVYMNRNNYQQLSANDYDPITASTITVMEIAQ